MALRPWLTLSLVVAAGCDRSTDRVPATCGFAAVAAASMLLEQFTIPDQTLSTPPTSLPERTVARVIDGGAYPAVVGRTDSLLVVGVEGSPPEGAKPGFGVLVVDQAERVLGVALYPGNPITGAPRLGDVSLGSETLPLIGVEVDPTRITDPNCPTLFPDSIIQ
jgi:hypothetical protein